MTPLPHQAPVQEMTEPRTRRAYLLYVPSTYHDRRTWPLLIACHGTNPFDSAPLEMREWAQFAQDRGILVAAPVLTATKGDVPPPPERQIARQHDDEEAILGIVSAIRGAYRIAPEQIFMTGWSAAAYVILDTGLKHPDVFRALAIRQGTFDERFMTVRQDQLDRWQPVFVIFGQSDFLRDQSKAMIAYLESRGMFVAREEVAGSHRRLDPGKVWGFFQKIVRERPWIRIRTAQAPGQQPRAIQFRIDAIPPVDMCRWMFGDDGESRDLEPVHTYQNAGSYTVTVNVRLQGGHLFQRSRTIWVDADPFAPTDTAPGTQP